MLLRASVYNVDWTRTRGLERALQLSVTAALDVRSAMAYAWCQKNGLME